MTTAYDNTGLRADDPNWLSVRTVLDQWNERRPAGPQQLVACRVAMALDAERSNLPITAGFLREKAVQFAKEAGVTHVADSREGVREKKRATIRNADRFAGVRVVRGARL